MADSPPHAIFLAGPNDAALQAAAILLQRIDAMSAQQRSFALETTLASKTYGPRITQWQAAGYCVDLHFLWLPAIERVATRVRSGGHDVPEPTIRRRSKRGMQNVKCRYLGAVNRWFVYNASSAVDPVCIAHGSDASLEIDDWPDRTALLGTTS